MSTEPNSATAKFANFLTSSGLQTSQAIPTTIAWDKFFLALFPETEIPSFRFSLSSSTVWWTDSGLRSRNQVGTLRLKKIDIEGRHWQKSKGSLKHSHLLRFQGTEYNLRDAMTTRSPDRRNSRASALPNPLVLKKICQRNYECISSSLSK